MAFRKTVKSFYQPSMHSGGFSEPKMVPVEVGDGISTMTLDEVSVDQLSQSALPLFGLEVIKATGKPIQGDVSFAPTDPTDFNHVQDFVGDYASRFESTPPSVESTSLSDEENV